MQAFRGKNAPAGDPLSGKLAAVTQLIADKKPTEALTIADAWIASSPDDMLAWIAQGRALEALQRWHEAARAYGSILDLAGRVEHRQAAASFLEALSSHYPPALEMAIELYRSGLAERRDRPSAHRLYAWSLARGGRFAEALDIAIEAFKARGGFDSNRYFRVRDVLKQDVGLLAAAAMKARPKDRDAIARRVVAAGAEIPVAPSTSLVLTWENDETDLDVLAYDGKSRLAIPDVDVRTGFGPELLALEPRAVYPVRVAVQRMTEGPTGHAVGKVAIVRHDGRGSLQIDDRPFVIMTPGAAATVATLQAP
jgi:tetratricopeptide (TPR) repeat protein